MHLFTCLPSLEITQEQFVVVCFLVANMGSDCETNCFFIQLFGRCASTDAPTILTAGMLCNHFLSSNRTIRIQFTNASSKTCYVFLIEFGSTNSCAGAPQFSCVCVRLALMFCQLNCCILYQQTLPLVTFACSAPFKDDGRELRVFSRTAGEGSVDGRQED